MNQNTGHDDLTAVELEIQNLVDLGRREAEIVRLLGISRGKVRYALEKLRRSQDIEAASFHKKQSHVSPIDTDVAEEFESDVPTYDPKKIVKALRSCPYSIDELVTLIGTENKGQAYAVLDDMESKGYMIQKGVRGYFVPHKLQRVGQINGYIKEAPHLIDDAQESFKFGVVSDTHLSSTHQQLTHLNTMYDLFVKEGITDVFNSGDMTEGNGRIYRGQVYEMFNHGADGQRDYLIEKYPSRPGITTHCIAGNHDYSFVESDGHDIIKGFALQRDDINYLGIYQADIIYNGVHIRLQHGAASGKGTDVLERYLKAYGEKDTPDILIVGHYHTAVMTRYNNCVAVTGGGWHADSHYLKRLGIKSEAMGWIFHVTVDRTTGKIIRCAPELIVFPEMLDHDF